MREGKKRIIQNVSFIKKSNKKQMKYGAKVPKRTKTKEAKKRIGRRKNNQHIQKLLSNKNVFASLTRSKRFQLKKISILKMLFGLKYGM